MLGMLARQSSGCPPATRDPARHRGLGERRPPGWPGPPHRVWGPVGVQRMPRYYSHSRRPHGRVRRREHREPGWPVLRARDGEVTQDDRGRTGPCEP